MKAPNLQRVWHPGYGIVFGASTSASTARSMSSTVTKQGLAYSTMEDEGNSCATEITSPTGPGAATINGNTAPTHDPANETPVDDPEQDELPLSTMPFKMSEEMFRGAKNGVPGSPESFWSHALYRGPGEDDSERKVKIHYCRSTHTTQRVLEQYFKNKQVLGFDMEWKPDTYRNGSIKKNVSLIQLASEDRIALIHIALFSGERIENLVAPGLKAMMEDPSITKVGVSIKADCTRLRKFLDIHARGIFELSHLHKLVKFSSSKDYKLINKRLVPLATQVQEHLHLPLFKGDVRSSDWSQALAMDQIIYAAADSYAGVHLFDTLEIKRKALNPTPPRPFHAEEDKPIRLAEGLEIPTDEELDPDEPTPIITKRKYTKLSSSYLAAAAETIELDPDFEIQTSLSSTTPQNSTHSATRSKSTPKAAPQRKHPIVLAGDSLSAAYRSSHPSHRAPPASLRCYFIWYNNPDLSLQDIAALLRDVPLQTTTVVNYILESIKVEKLPYEKERLKTVLEILPKDVAWGRYRILARACDEIGGEQ
jgi:hypothetical protein